MILRGLFLIALIAGSWAQQLPIARVTGSPYVAEYEYETVDNVKTYSSKTSQNIIVSSTAPHFLAIDPTSGTRVEVTQSAPVWRYVMTEIGRVPKSVRLVGASAVHTNDVDLYQKQAEELGAHVSELKSGLQSTRRHLLVIMSSVAIAMAASAAAMAGVALTKIAELQTEVKGLNNYVNGLATNMNELTKNLTDFSVNALIWQKKSEDRDALHDLRIQGLWNTTDKQMLAIEANSGLIDNITDYLALNAEQTNQRFANQMQNIVDLEAQVDQRFNASTEWAKDRFSEVYAALREQGTNQRKYIEYVLGLTEKLRRQVYALEGTVYDILEDAQMRRDLASSITRMMARTDPTQERNLISDDVRFPDAPTATPAQTLIERFRVGFVEWGKGARSAEHVAVRYDIEFYMDTLYAIDNARPYDTAENLLWHMVQLNCSREAGTDRNRMCNMWAQVTRYESPINTDTNCMAWSFARPTDTAGVSEMPTSCAQSAQPLVFPQPMITAVDSWRAFYRENICRATLALPEYQLLMWQLNRVATIRQDLSTCSLPFDQVLNLPVPGVERFIYKDFDFISPYLITQLSIDSEKIFGRAPSLGFRYIDTTMQSVYKDTSKLTSTTASVSGADKSRVRTALWNAVSIDSVPIYHFEPSNPVAMSAPTTVVSVSQPAGADYPVTETLVSTTLSVDTSLVSSLPRSGVFVGDLADDTTTVYDVPDEFLTVASDWRARQDKITALLMPPQTENTATLDDLLRINPMYDPTRVVSLDVFAAELGRITEGQDTGFPYCRVSGGVPANVSDVVEPDPDVTSTQEVPNGDWCSLLRNFNVRVLPETGAGGRPVKVLEVSPKQWTVQLALDIPSGKFVTNLGKGQCPMLAIRKVTDTQAALVFTNTDKYHAVVQRVGATNGSPLPICTLLQTVTVPALGTYTLTLPPCDDLVVTVEYPTTAAMDQWQACYKGYPGDLSQIIQSTVPVPPDVEYAVKKAVDLRYTDLSRATAQGAQLAIFTALVVATITNTSQAALSRIEALANATASHGYNSGNWSELLPDADVLRGMLDAIAAAADKQVEAARQARAEMDELRRKDAELALLGEKIAEEQRILRERNWVILDYIRNQTWFQPYFVHFSDDPYFDFMLDMVDAVGDTLGKVGDLLSKPFSFFSNMFDGIGNFFESLFAILIPVLIVFAVIWAYGKCKSAKSSVYIAGEAAAAVTGGRTRKERRGDEAPTIVYSDPGDNDTLLEHKR